jgi:transcriptional regulator with XRE-family HTH domain
MPINREVLRWARERLKPSFEDVAEELGVKPEQVQDWELGGKLPTVLQARRLAEVYDRPFLEFFAKEKPA